MDGIRRRGAAVLLATLALVGASGQEALAPGLQDAVCVACRAVLDDVRSGLSRADWDAVLSGEIVTSEGAGESDGAGVGRSVAAAGIVAAPPLQVWSVLTDWAAYPSFMPNIVETIVRRREGRRAWLSEHLQVFWSDVRYGVIWDLEPEAGRLHFALDPSVSHDIAATEGSWRLTPLPEERGTFVRYEARVDTGMAVPGFVQAALTRRSLPGLLRAVRAEVERRLAASR